ncbi:MAG: glutamine synthetase family protein [Rhodobacteraceae bacterium]|nr:glutamine synthetase family protein [Paracoccaceae bacterium]
MHGKASQGSGARTNIPPQGGTDVSSYRLAVCDLNGTLRGKRFPPSMLGKVLEHGARMPASILACDIWGEDYAFNEHLRISGDGDSICLPTGRAPLPVGWTAEPTIVVPAWMANEDGTPFAGDPRHGLAAVVKRLSDRGWHPAVAFELEFYLVRPGGTRPTPIASPVTGTPLDSDTILSIDELDDLEALFADMHAACERQDIKVETTTSENGPGQFEMNLEYSHDPLKAADDAVFFKRLARGIARRHNCVATFMAKPYGRQSGSSMHVHFSLCDQRGRNLFDDGSAAGSPLMHRAVAGILDGIQDSLLTYAPHMNSYRRPQTGSLAPTHASWGYENRTTAVRIPGGDGRARRIEFRVPGADANPYLALAAMLGCALDGMERKLQPPPAAQGYAYDRDLPPIGYEWARAIDDFSNSGKMAGIFSPSLMDMYSTCKRYELERFRKEVSGFEHRTYLEVA